MLPYPKELRERVVAAVEPGEHPIAEIANLFGVGVTVVNKRLRLPRAGADLEPPHGGGPAPLLRAKERSLLRQEVNKRPDATLEELHKTLADQAPVTASLPTLGRALQPLGLPRKKKSHRR